MTKMLKRVLQDVLSEEENEQLISAFDQIGDIIIVRIPDSLVSKKQIIGKTLLEQVSTANSIFYQSSPVEGDYRTRKLISISEVSHFLKRSKLFSAMFLSSWFFLLSFY